MNRQSPRPLCLYLCTCFVYLFRVSFDKKRDAAHGSRSRLALVWQSVSEAELYGIDEITAMQARAWAAGSWFCVLGHYDQHHLHAHNVESTNNCLTVDNVLEAPCLLKITRSVAMS